MQTARSDEPGKGLMEMMAAGEPSSSGSCANRRVRTVSPTCSGGGGRGQSAKTSVKSRQKMKGKRVACIMAQFETDLKDSLAVRKDRKELEYVVKLSKARICTGLFGGVTRAVF